MLRIRDDQWAAFEEDKQTRFLDRLVETMQKVWDGVCGRLGEDGTRARVEGGVAAAGERGFAEQQEQTRWVHLLFLLDRDGLDLPWAEAILGWEADPELKLLALEKRAAQEAERV